MTGVGCCVNAQHQMCSPGVTRSRLLDQSYPLVDRLAEIKFGTGIDCGWKCFPAYLSLQSTASLLHSIFLYLAVLLPNIRFGLKLVMTRILRLANIAVSCLWNAADSHLEANSILPFWNIRMILITKSPAHSYVVSSQATTHAAAAFCLKLMVISSSMIACLRW